MNITIKDIKKPMVKRQEAVANKIFDLADKHGVDNFIEKIRRIDLAAHPELTEEDREGLIGLIEVLV